MPPSGVDTGKWCKAVWSEIEADWSMCPSAFESCLGAIRCRGSDLASLKALEGLQRVDCKKCLLDALHNVEQHRQRALDSDGSCICGVHRRGSRVFMLVVKPEPTDLRKMLWNPLFWAIAKLQNHVRKGGVGGCKATPSEINSH